MIIRLHDSSYFQENIPNISSLNYQKTLALFLTILLCTWHYPKYFQQCSDPKESIVLFKLAVRFICYNLRSCQMWLDMTVKRSPRLWKRHIKISICNTKTTAPMNPCYWLRLSMSSESFSFLLLLSKQPSEDVNFWILYLMLVIFLSGRSRTKLRFRVNWKWKQTEITRNKTNTYINKRPERQREKRRRGRWRVAEKEEEEGAPPRCHLLIWQTAGSKDRRDDDVTTAGAVRKQQQFVCSVMD